MGNCWNFWMNGGQGSMLWLGLLWIILLVVIIILVIKLLTGRTDRRDRTDRMDARETPLEILQKEYARGNISEEEYLKRKKHLEELE